MSVITWVKHHSIQEKNLKAILFNLKRFNAISLYFSLKPSSKGQLCMKLSLLHFTLQLALAIRALKFGRIRSERLFQCTNRCFLGLQHFLHSVIVSKDASLRGLARLVKHSTLPFDLIYTSGCLQMMTHGRFAEIMSFTDHFGALEMRPLLLSVDCLKISPAIPKAMKTYLLSTYGTDSIFDIFPVNDDPPPSIKRELLICAYKAECGQRRSRPKLQLDEPARIRYLVPLNLTFQALQRTRRLEIPSSFMLQTPQSLQPSRLQVSQTDLNSS